MAVRQRTAPVEQGLTLRHIMAELVRSPHGKLDDYLPIGVAAVQQDANFFAHLIAWNHAHGQVRDAKVALPVIALMGHDKTNDAEAHAENALAHLAKLNPREFLAALEWARGPEDRKALKQPHQAHPGKTPHRLMRRLVTRYLRNLEANFGEWQRVAMQHRKTMRTLYGRYHVAPGGVRGSAMDVTLMRGQAETGRFAAVRGLAERPVGEILAAIRTHKLPFLIVRGALGKRMADPDVLAAVIGTMSAVELVTSMKTLDRLGVNQIPAARAALEQALDKAGKSTKGTLKTSRAAEQMTDPKLARKLGGLQERQLSAVGEINGRWAVLGDMSGSMSHSIKLATEVAAVLARMVKDQVHLIFFNDSPRLIGDVSGKTLDEIKNLTRSLNASGNTSIGCAVQYLSESRIEVDGIAVVSDGGENSTPMFAAAYKTYAQTMGIEPTIYLYDVDGDTNAMVRNCHAAGLDVQAFQLRNKAVDYYALPNLVKMMRVNRYALTDEVWKQPLLTLDQVLTKTVGMRVLAS